MKTVFSGRGRPRAGDGRPFAFFAVGALVVLAAVFVVGLQVGRYIEKREQAADASRQASPGPSERQEPAENIRAELGAYSAEAEGLKSVPPPEAGAGAETAPVGGLTFPETLARDKPAPVPLSGKAAGKSPKGSAPGSGGAASPHFVQAGVFRDVAAAAGLGDRLKKAGYPVVVRRAAGRKGPLHRVLVGPYAGREAALKALRTLKSDLKISGIMTRG